MSEYRPLNDDLSEFEQNLKSLRPTTPSLSEADLMFRAGQEFAQRESRRQLRRWQLSTLATSLCALMTASLFWFSPNTPIPADAIAERDRTNEPAVTQPTIPENITTELVESSNSPRESESQTPTTLENTTSNNNESRNTLRIGWIPSILKVSTPSGNSYLGLRNRVLEQGVGALPASTSGGSGTSMQEPLSSSPQQVREWLDDGFPTRI